MLEVVFFREVAVFIGGDVLFQCRGTLSVGLTRARGARGFEGDPAGANPSVGGHEHQRVTPVGESLRPRIVRDRAGSRTVRRRAAVWATMETQYPLTDGVIGASKAHYLRQMSASSIALVPSGSLRRDCEGSWCGGRTQARREFCPGRFLQPRDTKIGRAHV